MSALQYYCPERTLEVWEGRKYKLFESENFEEYMKALGVGAILRKLANSIKTTVELQKHELGWYSLITTSKYLNTKIHFKLGEEFDEVTADNRKIKSICSMEGNALLHEQKGNRPTSILREFSEDQMIATFRVEDVKATRTYYLTYDDEEEEQPEPDE